DAALARRAQRAVLGDPLRGLPPPRAAREPPRRGARRRADRPLSESARPPRGAARPPRRARGVDVPQPRRGVGGVPQERVPHPGRNAGAVPRRAGGLLGAVRAAAARLAVVPRLALRAQGRVRRVRAVPVARAPARAGLAAPRRAALDRLRARALDRPRPLEGPGGVAAAVRAPSAATLPPFCWRSLRSRLHAAVPLGP